jgi:hypothetical protein
LWTVHVCWKLPFLLGAFPVNHSVRKDNSFLVKGTPWQGNRKIFLWKTEEYVTDIEAFTSSKKRPKPVVTDTDKIVE